MTMSISDELDARLKSLQEGPWNQAAQLARTDVGLKKRPALQRHSFEKPLALDKLFANVEKSRQKRLMRSLAPHWKYDVREKDIPLRDSLDEALTYFQLVELAIETGYISLKDVKERARTELVRLLWAPAAQEYVRQYDYLAVGFLAKRLNVDIGYDVVPPPIDRSAEGRFALFLSQHFLWYGDEVDEWLGFLDDYQILEDDELDKDVVYEFLQSKTFAPESEIDILRLIAGAEQFLALLADLYSSLTAPERPRYGLFYLYWISKMLGYESDTTGFHRDKEQVDWAQAIVSSKRLQAYEQVLRADTDLLANHQIQLEAYRAYRIEIQDQVKCIRSWFSETLALVESGKLPARESKAKRRRRP